MILNHIGEMIYWHLFKKKQKNKKKKENIQAFEKYIQSPNLGYPKNKRNSIKRMMSYIKKFMKMSYTLKLKVCFSCEERLAYVRTQNSQT